MTADPFDLARFVRAQEPAYASVLGELRAGRKTRHWIWFIFPQLADLGRSPTAKHYGIAGADEARAYLAHPVLGPRLDECTRLMLAIDGKPLPQIMAFPDDLKFISSMTLFGAVASDASLYEAALARYCGGQHDRATLALLGDGI